jgi:hypothetical protein
MVLKSALVGCVRESNLPRHRSMEDGRLSTSWLLTLRDPGWLKKYTWVQLLDMRNMHTIGCATYSIMEKDGEGNDTQTTIETGAYCVFKTPRLVFLF